jgi:dipeptidyl aminopeptidase/acylaminoacyl peptidase
VRTETVEFFSAGCRIRGLWRRPDQPAEKIPAVVQGPGWMGLKDARDYTRYHEGFTAAGFGVLCIDYRGFGDSEGDSALTDPAAQVQDLRNAVAYLTTREDVEHEAIGAYATGGTGGGHVVVLAALEPQVRAVISQFPVADGRDWLRRMRTEWEWSRFLEAIAADRRERVRHGLGRLVAPREEIMVQTQERTATSFKHDVDSRVPAKVPLAIADALLDYRPVDYARTVRAPLLVIAVENDTTTPTDHAIAIYEAAQGPKKLIIQRHTTHYAAYAKYADQIIPEMVSWFRRYLVPPGDLAVRQSAGPGQNDE